MAAPAPAPLDLGNVQGDILIGGLPKKTETYVFFQIENAQAFRTQLTKLVPMITSTAQVQADRATIAQNKKDAKEKNVAPPLLKMCGVNISFTHTGLVKMGINDELGDTAFDAGMLAGAQGLNDPGTTSSAGVFSPNWDPAFKQDIHGLILVAGECHATVAEKLTEIEGIFTVGKSNASIVEVKRLVGDVRPGSEKGHEHFGFLDGISNPAVQGVDTNPNPGQETVRQGIVLVGRDGDALLTARPLWALDGAFIAFRFLSQLVPEFNAFLKQNPIPGVLPPSLGSDLLGARLVGRWKSGAPIDITPTKDDPVLGSDPLRNNDFRYGFPGDQTNQDRCPFAAHTRKTNPRDDLKAFGGTEIRRIVRAGIQFGPEVSAEEAASGKTQTDRGLLFAAYQSNILNGFQFIQQSWANTPGFPPGKGIPGFDPIVGQAVDPASRTLSGTNPSSQSNNLTLTAEWVVPKGGEYLFAPSIPALKGTLALARSSTEL